MFAVRLGSVLDQTVAPLALLTLVGSAAEIQIFTQILRFFVKVWQCKFFEITFLVEAAGNGLQIQVRDGEM